MLALERGRDRERRTHGVQNSGKAAFFVLQKQDIDTGIKLHF
jgi:hypothetical protein